MNDASEYRVQSAVAKLLAAAVFLAGCTDAFIQPRATDPSNIDNRLTLKGRVCTAPPDPGGFPVKVVLITDQSGSMCISDPPGAQSPPTAFCNNFANSAPNPRPARVRALDRLIAQFAPQRNVQIAIVPFDTNVTYAWPSQSSQGGQRFGSPADAQLPQYINGLQSRLGKGTDYQGALAYAYSLISDDIASTERTSPILLPRTRYVVVFLTDGTPYPRCSANDNLQPNAYADPNNPDLIWADSFSAVEFCNEIDPDDPDAITGYVKGTDRNQNYQLFSYVDRLMELKQQYNVGDIRLHSVLLFNVAAVRACGMICQDVYGQYPNTTPANYPLAAKQIAEWTLRRLAEKGNGVYQEFVDGDIQTMGLGALDYTSLASRNVMKTFLVQSMSSMPGDLDREVDADGDGLPDGLDNDFSYKTNNFFADSDGDCFDDGFEVLRMDRGFRANQKDGRGCDPQSPATPNCFCRDTDGDGLSQFAEAYLGTHTGLPDTDGDGVPDGLEARFGLDAKAPLAASVDTDGDGNPDALEFRAESDPTRRDREFYERNSYQFETVATEQPDHSVCYDFTITNLQMVTPPSSAGKRQGFNLYKLFFGEAPESGVGTDFGVWRSACAWAQYDPPSVRDPVGPQIDLTEQNFFPAAQMGSPTVYTRKNCSPGQACCVGNAP